MAVQDQNDVRGSTRILANAAKRYIDHVPEDNRHVPAMNGVFRLLKAYRASQLQGYEYQSHIDRGPDALSMLPAASRHVADLRVAVKDALSDAAGDQDPEIVIDAIQQVLRGIVAKSAEVDEDGRRTARRFLDSLLERLHAAD